MSTAVSEYAKKRIDKSLSGFDFLEELKPIFRTLGECVYSLRTIAATAQPTDVKTSIKDPSGKQTDNYVQFKLEYVRPNLDPDELPGTGEAANKEIEKKLTKKEAAKLKSLVLFVLINKFSITVLVVACSFFLNEFVSIPDPET